MKDLDRNEKEITKGDIINLQVTFRVFMKCGR